MIVRINENGNTKQVDLNSFDKDVISFGRLPSCDIVLKSDRVSRVHGAFYFDKGVWIIEDLKSRNGITMDGGKVKRATAKVGREFILYNSKENGKVSLTILQSSENVVMAKPVDKQIQPQRTASEIDASEFDIDEEVEVPKKSRKKRNIIIGAVAAVVLIAVVAILVNIDWMSKEEKAYYKYLAELVDKADDASDVNIIVEGKEEDTHYNYYAIADFDGDKDDELFILKELRYGYSRESVGEFYEYEDGEVKFENSFDMGSDEYPFTFYDNGVVKAGGFEYDIEIYYAGVHEGYLEDIGFLPLDGARGDSFKSYDGPICIECDEDYNEDMVYGVWNDEWDEMTTLSEQEYMDIFEFDAEVLDVELLEFDIEVIADKNRDDVEDYAVYDEINKFKDFNAEFKMNDMDAMDISYGPWEMYGCENGTAFVYEYYGPNKEVEIPKEFCGFKVVSVEGFECEYIESVIIPEGVERIGADAFYSCEFLTDVKIPGSVKTIGEYAFSYCSSLENVIIPDGVEVIENYAFGGNDNLTVELPESLEKLHKKAIGYCPNYDGGNDHKDKNCTIIGVKDSIAENYANDNNFNFKEK